MESDDIDRPYESDGGVVLDIITTTLYLWDLFVAGPLRRRRNLNAWHKQHSNV